MVPRCVPPGLRRFVDEPDQVRPRRLADLTSVGPAAIADFAALGIFKVEQLSDREPDQLYEELCELTGARHDPCVRDVFSAAVAQARDPNLPEEQRQWWYWTRVRKQAAPARRARRKSARGTKR
jgi:hypothetical protein